MGSNDNSNKPALDYRGTLQSLFHAVFVPQLYVFLGCIIIGLFKAEIQLETLYWLPQLDFKILILYFIVSSLTFVFYYCALLVSTHASSFLLSLELIFLSAMLFIGAKVLGIHSVSAILLPITLLALPVVWYLKGGLGAFRAVAPNLLVLASFTILSFFRESETGFAFSHVIGLIIHIFIVLGFIVLSSSIIGHLGVKDLPLINSSDDSVEDKETFLSALTQPIRFEFFGRFLPISLVASVATVVLGMLNEDLSLSYFSIWFSIVCLQILIFTQVQRENELSTICLFWIIQFGLLVTLWWQALLTGVIEYETAEVALLMLALTLGGMPWPGRFNLIFGAILLVIAAFLIPVSNIPIPLGFLMLFLIIFLTRQSSRNFINTASSALYPYFAPRIRGALTANDLAQQIAEMMFLTFDSVGALIIKADAQAFFKGHGTPEFYPEDKPVLAGIFQALKLLPHQIGSIRTNTLDRQILPSLYGWFGYLPQRLVYFKIELKTGFANELLIGIFPAGVTTRLVDEKTITSVLGQIIALVKSSIDGGRRSGKGTHIFISPVRDMGGVSEDVNEVIHSVNNSAQEVSRVIENLKSSTIEIVKNEAVISSSELITKTSSLLRIIESLEYGAQSIAMSASDIKWLKEASYATRPEVYETVRFDEIYSELRRFISFRQRKEAGNLEKDLIVKTDLSINVANRELLESCLRGIVRVLSRGRSADHLRISHIADSESLGLVFSFSAQQVKSLEEVFKARKDEEVLKAVQNFMFISDSELRFGANISKEGFAELILKFKISSQIVEPRDNRTGWALLVDDKAEIVNFYSSVAEALGLPYGIANNLSAARALIKAQGEPGIVVTDIQLDQENGLDLVKEIRESFGSAVPIIVVSGNVEENLRAQVFASGASRYLTKPVGRKKLFLEIQELLNEH